MAKSVKNTEATSLELSTTAPSVAATRSASSANSPEELAVVIPRNPETGIPLFIDEEGDVLSGIPRSAFKGDAINAAHKTDALTAWFDYQIAMKEIKLEEFNARVDSCASALAELKKKRAEVGVELTPEEKKARRIARLKAQLAKLEDADSDLLDDEEEEEED